MVKKRTCLVAVLALLGGIFKANAGEVTVVDATARDLGGERFSFSVTLKHADTGWDHYANKWTVFSADGKVLGVRELLHPHVNEQPFTRGLSGVEVPAGIKVVYIEGNDSVHGAGKQRFKVVLPGR